ncbi:MAG: PEP-CTERM sorting domain-containing protein [Pseudomonadota bacterium]
MTSYSLAFKSLSLAAMLLAAQAAHATITVYTNEAEYMAAVGATGIDNFDDFTTADGPAQRMAGDYSYSAATASGALSPRLYAVGEPNDGWLSVENARDKAVFSNFADHVRGVGGLFFNTDDKGGVASGRSITLTATEAEGDTRTYTVAVPQRDSFVGFVSTGTLSNITMAARGQTDFPFYYPTVNNLHISVAAVPEADSYAMLLAGLGLVGWTVRRRKRAAR